MKNRDVIEAFRTTLRDLPLPDQEERLQLFQEKLDGLDSGVPGARQERPGGGDGWGGPSVSREQTSGGGDGWGGPPVSREQTSGGGRQAGRNHSPRERSAFPVQMIAIALAFFALVEAMTIGVLLMFRGEKPDPDSLSSPPADVLTTPGGVAPPAPSTEPEQPLPSEEPAQTETPAPAQPSAGTVDVFLQMDGAGIQTDGTGIEDGGWPKCHATLFTDGTFTVTVDHTEGNAAANNGENAAANNGENTAANNGENTAANNEENNGENTEITTDSGTWAENGDGSLSLTGTRGFVVTLDDGVYNMEFVDAKTNIPCALSGRRDSVFVRLDGQAADGNDWPVYHATLMTGGTFTVTVDHNADDAGNEIDSGTWADNEDGSLSLTGTTGNFTVTLADGIYTMKLTDAGTGAEYELSGSA